MLEFFAETAVNQQAAAELLTGLEDQADSILQMPNPKDMSDADISGALKQAAARAITNYGPDMGKRVFADALKVAKRSRNERDDAAIIISSLSRGETKPNDWFGTPPQRSYMGYFMAVPIAP